MLKRHLYPALIALGLIAPAAFAQTIQITAPTANTNGSTPVTPLSTYRVCARLQVQGSTSVCAWIPAAGPVTTYALPHALIPAAGKYWVSVIDQAQSVVNSAKSKLLSVTVTTPPAAATSSPAPPTASIGGSNPPPTQVVKFHPGYYLELDQNASLAANIATTHSLKGAAGLKGVFLNVLWANMEGNMSDYSPGFAIVDALLAEATADNLQFMIGIQGKVFGNCVGNKGSDGALPAYFDTMKDSTGAAPLYLFATNNTVSGSLCVSPKNYDSVVTARRIAMVQAFGARYDANHNFEMWNDEDETANGLYTSSSQYDGDVTQDIVWAAAARQAFPTTGLRLTTNFMATPLEFANLFAGIVPYGIAVGGPDTTVNLPVYPFTGGVSLGTSNIVFNGYAGSLATAANPKQGVVKDYRGVLPWVAETQYGDTKPATSVAYMTTLYSDAMNDGGANAGVQYGGSMMPNYWLITEDNSVPGWTPTSVAAWIAAASPLNTARPSALH
jgi:hypothetical protein